MFFEEYGKIDSEYNKRTKENKRLIRYKNSRLGCVKLHFSRFDSLEEKKFFIFN